MAFRKREGFTLIELMIALVVGGMLMAGLVGLAGSMRRAFGHAKDVTDVQANLRFALMRMTDDLRRTAFMYLADPGDQTDPSKNCHLLGYYPSVGWSPTGGWRALEYDKDNHLFTLRGNYSSSRDYLLRMVGVGANSLRANTGGIICRNGMDYTPGPGACILGDLGMPYDAPFADGQPFSKLFTVGQVFRLQAHPGLFTYHIVTGLPSFSWGPGIQFHPEINLTDKNQGFTKWISPITTIQYQLIEKTAGSGNWTLVRRRFFGNTPDPDVELAEFLLPPTPSPDSSGFYVEIYEDTVAENCRKPVQPVITIPPTFLNGPVDAIRARALRITIRGRSPAEEPGFVLTNYASDSKALNYGYDLDGNPANGLAIVRTQRTVVQLQNMGRNLSM